MAKNFQNGVHEGFWGVDDKDVHKPRMKTTPSSKEMLRNFDKFIDTYVTGFKIPSAVLNELKYKKCKDKLRLGWAKISTALVNVNLGISLILVQFYLVWALFEMVC